MNQRLTRRSSRSAGFTLFEILLTLALLVAVAAMSWPAFTRAFENERLRKGADMVRTAWTNARLQAMSTGLTHAFEYEFGGNQFSIVASETDASGDSATVSSNAPGVSRPATLPDGISFYAGEKVVEGRSAAVEGDGGQTLPRVFFYPDGTTSTAQVLLSNSQERFLKVELRGMTATSRSGEIIGPDEVGL